MNDELSRILDDMKRGAASAVGTGGKMAYGVPTPSARSQATVEKVLEEALEVLADEGVAGLSFRALARRCDMRLSNLQYYFTTQEHLLSAITRFALAQRFQNLLEAEVLSIPEPLARLDAYLDFCMDRAEFARARTIITGLRDLAQRLDGPAAPFAEAYRFHHQVILTVLTETHPTASEGDLAQRAAMISALIDTVGPTGGRAFAPPEGLREAIRREVARLASAA